MRIMKTPAHFATNDVIKLSILLIIIVLLFTSTTVVAKCDDGGHSGGEGGHGGEEGWFGLGRGAMVYGTMTRNGDSTLTPFANGSVPVLMIIFLLFK